ncbi:MAG: hypothetical protein IKO83_08265 [Oscillospiraceae bacterium]|nr:hypothetical protein [Oscillospiraceae bacterium]
MNRLTRTLIALSLMILMLLPLCATAFAVSVASGPEDLRLHSYSFPYDQYYEAAKGDATILTIQVAASGDPSGAIKQANSLVADGVDAFVYFDGGMYYVMCGKFYNDYDALCYGEMIHMDHTWDSAFLNYAKLPTDAVKTFQGIFYGAIRVNPDSSVMESYWEEPSGAFFRADAEDTVEVYTVQFSKGNCFTRGESLRDRMERYGYPAFVYKVDLSYKMMTGMFLDRDEAKAYCKLIRRNTKEPDAVVKSALVPASEYESFVEWWSEQN